MIEGFVIVAKGAAYVVFGLVILYAAARLFFAAYFKSRNDARRQ